MSGLRESICGSNHRSDGKTKAEGINTLNKLGYNIRIRKLLKRNFNGYSVVFILCVILLVTKFYSLGKGICLEIRLKFLRKFLHSQRMN